jgi:hypothetical protein
MWGGWWRTSAVRYGLLHIRCIHILLCSHFHNTFCLLLLAVPFSLLSCPEEFPY